MTLLRADSLCFAYRAGAWAIDQLCFTLQPGERLALTGANGAGKSTLLHLLVGLLAPCQGRFLLDGLPASRDALRQACGLVLQDPDDQLFAHTVEADVIFGPLNSGASPDQAEAAARAALHLMAISHLAQRRISTLSLGEKKRVALAGVLALRPRLLLLDEPTAGLDHRAATALQQALLDRSAAGAAIVLATHNSDLALDWATRALVLENGRIIADDTPRKVFSSSQLCLRAGLRQPARATLAPL